MNKYTKFIKSKIGLILSLLIIFIPVNVKADETTPITITTSTKDVILVDGDTYNFVLSKDVNASSATAEISDTPFYVSEDDIYFEHSGHGEIRCGNKTWTKKYEAPDGSYTSFACNKCGFVQAIPGKVNSCSMECAYVTSASNYKAKAIVTIVANYEKLNGKTLTIQLGTSTSNSYTWNITVNIPRPRISSNLTLTKSPFFLIYKVFHLCAYFGIHPLFSLDLCALLVYYNII